MLTCNIGRLTTERAALFRLHWIIVDVCPEMVQTPQCFEQSFCTDSCDIVSQCVTSFLNWIACQLKQMLYRNRSKWRYSTTRRTGTALRTQKRSPSAHNGRACCEMRRFVTFSLHRSRI